VTYGKIIGGECPWALMEEGENHGMCGAGGRCISGRDIVGKSHCHVGGNCHMRELYENPGILKISTGLVKD